MIRCHGWVDIGYPVIYLGQSLDPTHSQTLVKRSLWRNFLTKTGNLQSKPNKFALLWGEAQLCLPYVCLREEK